MEKAKRLDDLSGGTVMNLDQPATHSHYYVYVDNLGLMSLDKSFVDDTLEACCETFNSKGLTLHETEKSEQLDALGVHLDGQRKSAQIGARRFWRIRGALRALLAMGRCTGAALEVIIGHCTFAGLLARDSLACFRTCY